MDSLCRGTGAHDFGVEPDEIATEEKPLKKLSTEERKKKILRRMRLLHRELAQMRMLEPPTDKTMQRLPAAPGCHGFEWRSDTARVDDDGGPTLSFDSWLNPKCV